jgi:thymidylate synthase (FAD)
MKVTARLIAATRPINAEDLGLFESLDLIEYAGRWDYGQKSVAKMGDRDIIRRWLEGGEESMVEMVDATFLIECSRVVTHELVRHRIASYQQESQRFVKYDEENPDDLFLVPEEIVGAGEAAEILYRDLVELSLKTYNELKSAGVRSQIARYVLPNATRTRIIVKMNLREWRHVLRLRLHTSAQPEMREVMAQVLPALQAEFGNVLFPDDIAAERGAR